ncbi:phosphotransferase [Blastococcus brunescens]|uniref:Phosphotransferase n=1 Tax=Blastococcus brunescens TaxID=1564165 RepID=A0ABZ1B0K7_9ACTN|nr:phosphotransferase [Blastococcus sp. BMG 8361]WRL64342.1 phosphotransferase [Blastococcus sp. BMG 8361]
MRRQVGKDEIDQARDALVRALDDTAPERLELATEPITRSRSTVFVFGVAGEQPRYVVKTAVLGNTAIDATPALTSTEQFRALTLAHGWFEEEDRHAAVRPLSYVEELDAVVMDYVHGQPFRRTVQRGVLQPGPALAAATAAGDALRRLHRHARVDEAVIDLADLADEVRETEATVLREAGLGLPEDVATAVAGVPNRKVTCDRVVQHGDFAPVNLILTAADQVTIIDPSLVDVGLPEDDLARFLAILSAYSVFVPGQVVRPVRRFRWQLERAFRSGYGEGTPTRPSWSCDC